MSEYLLSVPIERIVPNPANPRKTFDPEKLQELADSIKNVGLLEPLLVAEMDGDLKYPLICGERRWRAAQLAGLTEVPCVVRDLDERQQLEAMVTENLQRADLDAIEEARGFETLVRECGYTEVQVAERISKSQPYVANRMRLLKLPESVQASISQGILSPSHGKVLLSLDGMPAPVIEKLAERVIKSGQSVSGFESELPWRLKQETRALDPNSGWPRLAFDLSECADCEYRRELKLEGKNESRCTNPGCWDERQAKAEEGSRMESRQELYAETAAASERGVRVVQPTELQREEYEHLSSYCRQIDTSKCDGCSDRAKMVPGYGTKLFDICLRPDCIKQQIADRNARREAIEAQRLERLKEEAKKQGQVTKETLVWTILTLIKGSYYFKQEVCAEWPIEDDDTATMIDYLETLLYPDLCVMLTELLSRYHDNRSGDPELKFCTGFRYPAKAEDILAGKATIDDIQVYTDVEDDDGTEASDESEATDDEAQDVA